MPLESHVYAGCQFPGTRHEKEQIAKVIDEIERQKDRRWDSVVATKKLEFKVLDNQLLLAINTTGRNELVPVTKQVHRQLAQYVGIRMTDRCYRWLTTGTDTPKQKNPPPVSSNWKSLANLYNDYLHSKAESRMLRCMENADGQLYARAFLSDRYEVIPNADYFYAIFDSLKAVGADIWHARLSEDKFYVYAVAEGISAQVNTERSFDPGDGWQSRWYGKDGDVVNAALCGSNSETGEGGVTISQAILRRVCVNYCVWQDVISKTHIGARHETDKLLSDETIKKRNSFFFSKIGDLTKATFSPEQFQKIVDAMEGASKDVIEDGEKAVNALAVVYDITDERRNAIRNLFLQQHDFSRYGMANAVTQFAHQKEGDAQSAFALEQLGTDLLMTPWTQIEKKAEKLLKEQEAAVG